MRTLQERLKEWQDFDVAAYELGVTLGLFEDDPQGTYEAFRANKGIFWSDNPLGNALYGILQSLAEQDFLDWDREESKYRWSPTAPGFQEGTKLSPRTAQIR